LGRPDELNGLVVPQRTAIIEPARLIRKSYEISHATLVRTYTLYQFSGFSFKLMNERPVLLKVGAFRDFSLEQQRSD
jgi:hypothetical protein